MLSINSYLRKYSKLICLITLCLIFLGGLVKSTESGLSVPDWPTTYGKFMFAYPLDKMAGGIKYEHTHRMLASVVGLMTLVLCMWLFRSNVNILVKRLGLAAFITVILQGVLGGLTVRYFLPVWLSTMHGVLAQTFFLILILIAYNLSKEYIQREKTSYKSTKSWIAMMIIFTLFVYVQLIIANWMRHSEAGLAVGDFPTMGGAFLPSMDETMLNNINTWRFENNLDPVTMFQVQIHLLHRLFALIIVVFLFYINTIAYKKYFNNALIIKTLMLLNFAVLLQIMFGISAVLFKKEPIVTTFHVAIGAIVLGLSFLLILRSSPVKWNDFKSLVFKN